MIHAEQTHTHVGFCHVMEPAGLNVPVVQQHINNNTSQGLRSIKPAHGEGELDFSISCVWRCYSNNFKPLTLPLAGKQTKDE